MTYTRLIQDGSGGWWAMGNQSYPVQLELCPACGAIVADSHWHTEWHEQLEVTDD